MRQAEIRQAVTRQLRREHGTRSGTVYRYELGVCLGETRVDVAAINGRLIGCEIKSDGDRLSRLDRQIDLYNRVLDSAVLVTGPRFAPHAVELVPDWWGVWLCLPSGRWPRIEEVRVAGRNPRTDPFSVAQLLWRDEAFDVLDSRGLARGLRAATRWVLWEALATSLTEVELGGAVRARLKARRGW